MCDAKLWELIHDLNRQDLQDNLSLKEFLNCFNSKLEKMFDTNWDDFVSELIRGEK